MKELRIIAPGQASVKWIPLIVTVNLVLGVVLWFGLFTDYSLAGTLPDLIFTPTVGLVGFISFVILLARVSIERKGCFAPLACLPSLIGGCLPVVVTLLLILPPFTLGFIFAMDEMANETRIQQAVSPNGFWIAEVYFRGVGAYDSGNGRIFVRVKPQWFPFVERDIYSLSKSYADENTTDYLCWIDDDTLLISETQKEIKVGIVDFEIPSFMLRLLFMLKMLIVVGFSIQS
ncbi:MAG: hypothetical protein SVX38_03985 [Chloroflexota bacterium]|nr:hypothetical protein [Chloroflexota bacterium]